MDLVFRYPHFVVLLMAYIASDFAVAMLARAARRLGATDRPGATLYKVQAQPVPFLGGFGLFVGFVIALLTTLDWRTFTSGQFQDFFSDRETRVVMATFFGGAAMTILGLLDDFKPIQALVKLGVLFLVTAALAKLGVMVNLPIGVALNFIVTLLWIVGVVSAFNAVDNTDGVAGVTAANAALWTFFVAWGTSAADAQAGQSFLTIALLGATLGFLRHNRPRARVYMGNSGAFLLGFIIAVMSISGTWASPGTKSMPLNDALVALAPLLLLSYPLFDLCYTVFMRWRAGVVRNIFEAVVVSGRDHTAHRLAALGLGPWGVIGVVAMLNGVGGFAAFALVRHRFDPAWTLGISAAVLVMYLVFGWVIRHTIDLRSAEARISHRKPTGPLDKPVGGGSADIPSSADEWRTRKVDAASRDIVDGSPDRSPPLGP